MDSLCYWLYGMAIIDSIKIYVVTEIIFFENRWAVELNFNQIKKSIKVIQDQ